MNTCIVCGKEVHIDDGYATDGKIFVCRKCAEIHTLRTITVHISNADVESNLVYKREAPIEMATESGLVDQTDEKPSVELDKSVLDNLPKAELVLEEEYEGEIEADIENMSEDDFMSKYCNDGYAIGKWHEANSDKFPLPNGCSKDCPYYPYDTCGHYYGEIHACMLHEEEIEADIESMSPEDFMSKYADNPTAITDYMDNRPEECNTY